MTTISSPKSRNSLIASSLRFAPRCTPRTTPLLVMLLLIAAALPLSAQSIDFRSAIELALKHSGVMVAASADRARAAARYRAERAPYAPSVVFGSGLGYNFGVPIPVGGQLPTLFNVTHDQTVLNFSLRESIKAAHSDSIAANIDYLDHAEQVILDTSLLYIELDNTQQRLTAAQQEKESLDRALYIAQQRQQEGVGSALDSKRAELDSARVDLRITELDTSLDLLRERLGRSIGRSPATLSTVSDSIPIAPAVSAGDDLASVALANSASVRVADEHLRAARDRARAEHKMNLPSINFGGQYNQYASFQNYSQFYQHFTNEAYSFGISLRVPILNFAQNAKAAVADAEALHAESDAQLTRDQVAADAVKAQHAIGQLQASTKVTRLEYEVAQANIDAVQLQIENGHASARDEELARADVAGLQVALLQSQFEYFRAQLQLLRQTGALHAWALGNK